jgi:hypothetical protein
VEGFDGETLRLAFPEELAIYVKLAGEPKRTKPLQEILEERLGTRPRLEFQVAGADGAARARGETTNEGVLPTSLQPPRETPETMPETPAQGGEPRNGAAEAAEGLGGGDDTVRDPQEVFVMARERFGARDQQGGGG